MDSLLNKISQYNIFNYLFPGIIYSLVIKNIGSFNLLPENQILSFFLFYFIGLVVSRIGSLLLEPLLLKIHFIKYQTYDKYIGAEKNDGKIDILLEVNNMYRTLISLIVLISITLFLKYCCKKNGIDSLYIEICIFILLALLFLFSYKKQTSYIYKRIDCITKQEEK